MQNRIHGRYFINKLYKLLIGSHEMDVRIIDLSLNAVKISIPKEKQYEILKGKDIILNIEDNIFSCEIFYITGDKYILKFINLGRKKINFLYKFLLKYSLIEDKRRNTIISKKDIIFITGASGFIGGRLAQVFLQRGYRVRILARKKSNLTHLENEKVEVFYGDIRDKESLYTAIKGVNYIYHCAAISKDWGEWEDFYKVNVEGVKNILEASTLANRKDETDRYSATTSYSMPTQYSFMPQVISNILTFIIPTSLSGSYTNDTKKTDYGWNNGSFVPILGKEDITKVTKSFSSGINFAYALNKIPIINKTPILKNINASLSPSYSTSKVNNKKTRFSDEGIDNYLESSTQQIGINSSVTLFSWFKPNFSYSSNINQNYDIKTSTNTGKVNTPYKDIGRSNNTSIYAAINMSHIIRGSNPFSTMNLSGNYTKEKRDNWENIDIHEDFSEKFVIKESEILEENINNMNQFRTQNQEQARLKSNSRLINTNINNTWKPFNFINLNGRFEPIKTLNTTLTYTNNNTKNNETGTKSFNFTEIWPNVQIDIFNLEKLIVKNNILSEINLTNKYSNKLIETGDIINSENHVNSETISKNINSTCRFKLVKKFDFSFNYNQDKFNEKTRNPDILAITKHGYNINYGGQVSINYKAWRLTPSYNDTKSIAHDKTSKTTDNNSQTYSLTITGDFNLPTQIKIPLIDRIVRLSNRFIVTNTLSALTQEDALNMENNRSEYSGALECTYDMRRNFQMSLGTKYTQVLHEQEEKKKDNYNSIEATLNLSIIF